MVGEGLGRASALNMDTTAKNHSHHTLATSGTATGLSEGLIGKSEVGHGINRGP